MVMTLELLLFFATDLDSKYFLLSIIYFT